MYQPKNVKSSILLVSLHSSDATYTKKAKKNTPYNLKHLGHYVLPHETLVEGLGLKCSGFHSEDLGVMGFQDQWTKV